MTGPPGQQPERPAESDAAERVGQRRPGPLGVDWNAAILTLWVLAVVLGLGAVVAALVFGGEADRAGGVVAAMVLGPWRIVPFVLWVPVAGAAAVRLSSTSWPGWSTARAALVLRVTVYAILLGVAITSVAASFGPLGADDRLASGLREWVTAVLLVGVLLAFCGAPGLLGAPKGRAARPADLVLFNVAALLLCGEAVIAAAARFSSSPILLFDSLAGDRALEPRVKDSLRRFAFKPHAQFFDRALNSGGFVDDEPFVAGKRDFVVALLADSFGVGGGVVPYDYNFATVAERRLQATDAARRFDRVAVQNYGVARIGVPEYFYLMLTEALPRNPALVAVCVFVGNDIEPGLNGETESAGYSLFRNWRIVELPRRLWRVASERRHGNPELLGTIDQLPKGVPAYVHDDRLEPATFSEERFMQIEIERVATCDAQRPDIAERFQGVFGYLDRFEKVLHEKLLIVVIPDEYQVNDRLWARLLEVSPDRGALDRDLPQKRLVGYCQEHGIAVLDLLPTLRAAQRQGRTYHLRDTHWNARGNQVAGEAIADWVLQHRLGGA